MLPATTHAHQLAALQMLWQFQYQFAQAQNAQIVHLQPAADNTEMLRVNCAVQKGVLCTICPITCMVHMQLACSL
jgi:hypothetical protein